MEYQEELGKVIININGQEKEYDVLFTFDCEENGKSYIGFNDGTYDEKGKKNICVKRFDPIVGFDLEDITEAEELKMVNEVLNQFLQS